MKYLKKVATTPLEAIAKVIDSLQAQSNDRQNAPSIYAVRKGLNDVTEEINDAKSELNTEISTTNAALSETSLSLATTIASLNDTITRLNNVWSTIYPVGSIYINVNDVDPSTLFGGTWVRIEDKFLLASGTSYETGREGGSMITHITPAGTVNGHALTVPELPEHVHGYFAGFPDNDPDFGYYHLADGSKNIPKVITDSSYNNPLLGVWNNDHTERAQGVAHSHTFTGTEQTINTMPRYLAVNVWYRTA